MKKIKELVKPLLSIIFGALLLLLYMNYLRLEGAGLAVGIIAVVFAAYYLAFGIIDVIIGNKLNKTLKLVFDILNVSLFALLIFVIDLLTIINGADALGPTGWVIQLVGLVASLLLVTFYVIARVTGNAVMARFSFLFAALFALALLLDIIFEPDGTPNVLGNIVMIVVAIDVLYIEILFTSIPSPLTKKEEAAPAEEKAAE